jgi:hypothetical protein
MTYPELLSAIYSSYDALLPAWNLDVGEAGVVGAFAFFPEGYTLAAGMDETQYEFWPMPRVREFLEAGNPADNGYLDLLADFGLGRDILVMIVEEVPGQKKRAVHMHKINKLPLN